MKVIKSSAQITETRGLKMATKPPSKSGKSSAKASKTSKAAAKKAPAKKTAPKAARKAATSTVIPFAPITAESLNSTINDTMSRLGQNLGGATPEFKTYFTAMESNMTDYKKQYEKMTNDGSATMREGFEGYIQAGTSFMKGAEVMMKTCMEMAQESAERNSEAMKNLMACRTLNEAAEQQNKMVQANLDEAMSAASKLSEMAIKICTEACEPLNEQVNKAMQNMAA